MDGQSELTVGIRRRSRLAHVPATVELVVAVDGQAVVERGEHGLAARLDVSNDSACEARREAGEAFTRQGKAALADDTAVEALITPW